MLVGLARLVALLVSQLELAIFVAISVAILVATSVAILIAPLLAFPPPPYSFLLSLHPRLNHMAVRTMLSTSCKLHLS